MKTRVVSIGALGECSPSPPTKAIVECPPQDKYTDPSPLAKDTELHPIFYKNIILIPTHAPKVKNTDNTLPTRTLTPPNFKNYTEMITGAKNNIPPPLQQDRSPALHFDEFRF